MLTLGVEENENDSPVLTKYRALMQNDVIGEPLGKKDLDASKGNCKQFLANNYKCFKCVLTASG